jgi:acyl-CoA synthetase (AMP-forming)/AMP-acid ligase II
MAGYYNRPEATRDSIDSDGWLHTGDRGLLDAEGRLVIVGRMKHMYKSGGYNIYPREIEMTLERHRGVALACVVSAPDPKFDEIGIAYLLSVVGKELTAECIEAFARERMANYKIPKKFVICDKFPEVEVGKVDRVALTRAAQREWQAGTKKI